MAIFTVITMAYCLTFSQGAGFKAAREQAKCRKDSAGLGPSTAILFVSCRTRRKYSESLGRRSCSSSLLSNYFPLISGYLVYCNFVYCYTARKIWNTEERYKRNLKYSLGWKKELYEHKKAPKNVFKGVVWNASLRLSERHAGRRLKGLTFQTSFELVFKLFGDREECHLEKIYCISPKSPSASTKVT